MVGFSGPEPGDGMAEPREASRLVGPVPERPRRCGQTARRGPLTRVRHGVTLAGRDVGAKESPMAWNLSGNYSETCSCELMCPCNTSLDHGATYDFCRVVLAFAIRDGQVEGTDIGGRRVVLIADTPKVMTDGGWKLGVYVDDQADDEQFDKLVKVFGGQLGGPMGALAPLVGEVLGVERAAISMSDDGLRHSVRVGDTIDFEVQ